MDMRAKGSLLAIVLSVPNKRVDKDVLSASRLDPKAGIQQISQGLRAARVRCDNGSPCAAGRLRDPDRLTGGLRAPKQNDVSLGAR